MRENEVPQPRSQPFAHDLLGANGAQKATKFLEWYVLLGHPGLKVRV